MKRITNDEFIQKMSIENPNLIVLGEYKNRTTKIKYRCKTCNNEGEAMACHLYSLKCPYCTGRKVKKGFNDVATTHPHLIECFEDKTDAEKYTHGSSKKVNLVCPNCGLKKQMRISHLTRNNGMSCLKCSDGVSYPNKFCREMITQLPATNIYFEWQPEWCKLYKYFYDIYFEFNNNKYILEIDGEQHYYPTYGEEEFEKTIKHDRHKEKLAEEHNINLIRVKCFRNNKNQLIDNIYRSELQHIFDLSIIDFNACHKAGLTNLINEVCSYYNSTDAYTFQIAEKFRLSKSTIVNYLNYGHSIGICNFSKEDQEDHRVSRLREVSGKKVKAYDENHIFIGEFNTITECVNILSNKYNKKFTISNISKVCKGKGKSCFGFIFEYC